MAELDIRLGVSGLRLENKQEVIDAINNTLTECKEVLTVACDTDDAYKLYKDVRKQLKDERNIIWNAVKEKCTSFTASIESDKKELYGMYDELYNALDEAIKAYETEYNCGATKAAATRKANKAAQAATADALTITLKCPSEQAKARIIQFAQELGATLA